LSYAGTRLTIRVALHHRTTYGYIGAYRLHPRRQLRPARTAALRCCYSLRVSPTRTSSIGSRTHRELRGRLVFTERTNKSRLTSISSPTSRRSIHSIFSGKDAERFGFSYSPLLSATSVHISNVWRVPAIQRIRRRPSTPILHGNAASSTFSSTSIRRASKLTYELRMDPSLRPERTLELGGIVPRLRMVLVQVLRHIGLAARFASDTPCSSRRRATSKAHRVLEDVVDLHAWTEVFLPGAGGGARRDERLLVERAYPLACTPDPEPLRLSRELFLGETRTDRR